MQKPAAPENAKADMKVADINNNNADLEGRKIIYNANSIINVKDIKSAYNSIVNKTQEVGGYIANSNIHDINSQITIKVPAQKLKEFLTYLDTLGDSKESSISTNDVTDQYTDTKSRVKNLKAQEEQILLIMKKAVTVDEILKIQNELSRVRGEIESYEGRINMWDKLVELSTVTVNLNKVQEIGGKEVKVAFISWNEIIKGMSNGFKGTLNFVVRFISSVFVVIISAIPVIPFIAIGVWLFIKYRKKTKKNISQ